MNREQKIRRAHLLNHGLSAAAIALFASLAGLPFAHAASFRCAHDASASERLVCNDPTLSVLDDKLAALYRSAFDATPDTTALEADRISQWQWRQHNCKDKACVTDWYNRRIAELEGDLKHGQRAAVQRVKEGVASQDLAPCAQDAVLELKGIAAAAKCQSAAPVSSGQGAKGVTTAAAKLAAADAKAPLHLEKMPSGVAADARQKRLANAHAHHIPAGDAAPADQAKASAMAAKMAGASTAFAKAAGMATLDAPLDPPAKSAGSRATDSTADVAAASPAAMTPVPAAAEQPAQSAAHSGAETGAQAGTPGTQAVTCSAVASAEPARAADSTAQPGTVALK